MNSIVTESFRDFVSLFYPDCCTACGDALVKGEHSICTACLLEMPRTNYHLEVQNNFYRKFQGRLPVTHVMALFRFVKQSRVQHLLHALKYRNHPEVGVALGNIYAGDLMSAQFANAFDLIIPVPLHPAKKRMRGYNQSEQFGIGLSDGLQITCSDEILRRVKRTDTQTRKTKLRRWENVSDGFSISDPKQIENKRILLVDDVITTGATLEACGRALLNAGSASISIACIAAAQ